MIREYSIQSKDGENEIVVVNLEKEGTVIHHGGSKTTLMLGRITKTGRGNAILVDSADFLSFELPYGVELTEELLTKAMQQYDQKIQLKNSTQSSYYLGRLTRNEQGESVYSNKSMAVEAKVAEIVREQIQEREEQIRKNMAENVETAKRADKEAMYRSSLSAREHLARKTQEKETRKLHPFLKKDSYPLDKTNNPDYTGVDMNTGDILRVRHVDKIGKDGSGTYLYSAYLARKENETDVEFVDVEDSGYPFVCFELQKRLEDIVHEQNQQEVAILLELLSDDRAFESRDKLTYLGEIDKSGRINRRETSTSSAIQARIEFMKKQYEAKMKERVGKEK